MSSVCPTEVALELLAELHPQADCLLLAGSVLRGEATAYSDLDVVVIYRSLPQAYRQSLMRSGWPVELFVHDPETLEYYMQEGRISGVPSMVSMVLEGRELPTPTPLSHTLRARAEEIWNAGPAPWSESQRDMARYHISDLCDDLREPRNRAEMVASACRLYSTLIDFRLRTCGHWSGTGKSLIRQLRKLQPQACEPLETAFEALFRDGRTSDVLELAGDWLAPWGGWLFAGPALPAPALARICRVRLTSQDLVIRSVEEGERERVRQYYLDNQDHLAPWEPRRLPDFVPDCSVRPDSLRLFLFPRKGEQGPVVGTIHLSQIVRGPLQACYLGFSLDFRYQGRGWMAQALTRVLDYAFSELGLHRVMANYQPENLRSQRVLERVGFQVEGRAAAYLEIGGYWRDHVLTSICRDNWPPGPVDSTTQAC